MCAVRLCCYILRAISGHHTYCNTDRIISQATSLSTKPQQRRLPSWRRACMAKDVSIFVTRVSFSLVCFSVCSQPPSAASHMVFVFPPSVTSSHFLLQLKPPRETKRSFYFSGCMLSVFASRSCRSCLLLFFLEIFSRLAFHFTLFIFFLLQDGVRP